MKRLIPLIIFIAICIFLVIGLNLNPKEVPSPFIGKSAPAFSLNTLDPTNPSRTFSPSQMQGKVWLLNVWASWCTTCREEHPLLVDLAKEQVVPIIGLNYKDKNDAAIDWLSHMGNPYELSVVDANGKVGIDYGVYGVPETFVINQKGTIVHKHIGPLTEVAIEQEILPLVRKFNSTIP